MFGWNARRCNFVHAARGSKSESLDRLLWDTHNSAKDEQAARGVRVANLLWDSFNTSSDGSVPSAWMPLDCSALCIRLRHLKWAMPSKAEMEIKLLNARLTFCKLRSVAIAPRSSTPLLAKLRSVRLSRSSPKAAVRIASSVTNILRISTWLDYPNSLSTVPYSAYSILSLCCSEPLRLSVWREAKGTFDFKITRNSISQTVE
mmetsp:Transcript_24820/g.46986  ORF Transcript_24820/g.46986 Transcript_24820/m.46986 type:complete len:203 (-) Transcript_24820:92-700(-)